MVFFVPEYTCPYRGAWEKNERRFYCLLYINIENRCQWEFPNICGQIEMDISGWRLAEIFYDQTVVNGIADKIGLGVTFRPYIGAQLSFRRLFSAGYQAPRRPPQKDSGQEQERGERGEKRVRDLNSEAMERRPELGSFFAMILGLVAAMLLIRPYGSKRGVCFLLRVVLGSARVIDGLFGFLWGFDLWSLWQSLRGRRLDTRSGCLSILRCRARVGSKQEHDRKGGESSHCPRSVPQPQGYVESFPKRRLF